MVRIIIITGHNNNAATLLLLSYIIEGVQILFKIMLSLPCCPINNLTEFLSCLLITIHRTVDCLEDENNHVAIVGVISRARDF